MNNLLEEYQNKVVNIMMNKKVYSMMMLNNTSTFFKWIASNLYNLSLNSYLSTFLSEPLIY